jgi:hypothetical protein
MSVATKKVPPHRMDEVRIECAVSEARHDPAACSLQVDDLEQELTGKKMIIGANSPGPRVTVAFIEDNGRGLSFTDR